MSTAGSQAGLETFDALNIEYKRAYHDNVFKVACIKTAISMLAPGSRVLDVGCGTGMPVSELLSSAGLEVFGFDISPKMVHYAQSRVKGTFVVSDMLKYEPEGKFAATYKFSQALEAGGILVLGQMPADKYVKENSDWDETKTYSEEYDAPFMGKMLPTLALSAEGQLEFLRSMGLEIISNRIDTFQPNSQKCVPEEQQYIIAWRSDEKPLSPPKPFPRSQN